MRASRKGVKFFLAYGLPQSQNVYEERQSSKNSSFYENVYKRSLEELSKNKQSQEKSQRVVSWQEAKERRRQGSGNQMTGSKTNVDLGQRLHMDDENGNHSGSGEIWDEEIECSLVTEFLFHNSDR